MEKQEDIGVQRMTTSPITGGESTARNTASPQTDQSSDGEEDSKFNVMDSAFEFIPKIFEDRISPDINTKTFEDDEKVYLPDEWQWNSWEEDDIDTEIEGSKDDDQYSGPCGLKNGVPEKSVTVVQCPFETTAIN